MEVTMTDTHPVTRDVAELEDAYARAVNAGDWDAVAALLAPGFGYTHGDGRRDDAGTFLARMRGYRSYRMERLSLDVHRYGNVTIATGVLSSERYNHGRPEKGGSAKPVIHVWTRSDEGAGWSLQAHISIKNPR
jgi:ketosteroid isomerase-like protein